MEFSIPIAKLTSSFYKIVLLPNSEFLSYHVVDGLFYSNDLKDGQFLPTLLSEHEIQVGVRVEQCQRKWNLSLTVIDFD